MTAAWAVSVTLSALQNLVRAAATVDLLRQVQNGFSLDYSL